MVSLQAAQDGLPAIAPTFMPAAMERTVHTRSSGTHPDRGQRMKQEVTVTTNLVFHLNKVHFAPNQLATSRSRSNTIFATSLG